jgi:hypothetical protein
MRQPEGRDAGCVYPDLPTIRVSLGGLAASK